MRQGLLGAVLIVVSACGMGQPNQGDLATIDSELNLGEKEVTVPDRDCRNVSVRPLASGTVRAATDTVEVAQIGPRVQSMVVAHATYGSEARHGVVEFKLPALGGRLTRAELRFVDQHGYQVQEVPADVHNLNLNGQVDGVITADDWVREGFPFASFSTDLNDLNMPEHRFDIRGQVRLGGLLGMRLNLDRTGVPVGEYGSSFEDFRVELTVCNEEQLPDGVPTGDPL